MEKELDKKFLTNTLIVLGVAGGVIVIALFDGFVTSLLWNWTIPQIFGLPQLTVAQAVALSLLLRWMIPTPATTTTKPSDSIFSSLLSKLIKALVLLSIARIIAPFL